MKFILLTTAMLMSSLTAVAQGKVLSATVNEVEYKFSEKGFTNRAAATQFCKDLKMNLVVGEDILEIAITASIEGAKELEKATTFEVRHENDQVSGVMGWISEADSAQYQGADAFSIVDGRGMDSEAFKLADANKELKANGVPEITIRAICK